MSHFDSFDIQNVVADMSGLASAADDKKPPKASSSSTLSRKKAVRKKAKDKDRGKTISVVQQIKDQDIVDSGSVAVGSPAIKRVKSKSGHARSMSVGTFPADGASHLGKNDRIKEKEKKKKLAIVFFDNQPHRANLETIIRETLLTFCLGLVFISFKLKRKGN